MAEKRTAEWQDRFEEMLNTYRSRMETVWLPRAKPGLLMNMLEALEPVRRLGTVELRHMMGKDRLAFNCSISRGRRSGLVVTNGKTVEITQEGRWQVIAHRLGLKPKELCAVSDIYVHEAGMRKIGLCRYVKGNILKGRLGIGHRGMIRIYAKLVNMGYVRCKYVLEGTYRPTLLCIDDGFMGRLHGYMEDMVRLQFARWRFGLPPAAKTQDGGQAEA